MKKFTKKEFILFFLIFLLGAFPKLYRLDYPLGLHGDEAWIGIEARRIIQEGSISIWSESTQATLPFYWTAIIFKLFGISLFTLRLSFALLHILALPFFYLTVRLLFTKEVALISFFLFSTSHIFIHFSHVATGGHALFIIPFLPSIFFFLLTLKTKKIIFALLSGFLLSVSQYFYIGLRILPFLFFSFLIYKSLNKDFLVSTWKHIVILFLTSFITFLPLGQYFARNSDVMFARSSVNIFSTQGLHHARTSYYNDLSFPEIILQQIKSTALMFHVRGDGDQQDNYQNLPLFDFVTGIFFILGLITSLKKVRSESIVFLFIWFFIFLSGTIFTVDAPNFRRVQPSIAASYIFATLGIIWTYSTLKNRFRNSTILLSMLLLYLAFIAWGNIDLYFRKQAISDETKHTFSYPLVRSAQLLNTLPNPVYVYFYSSSWSYNYETMRFLAPDILGEDRSSQFGSYSLINTHSNKNVAYIFLSNYLQDIDTVRELYPNGKIITEKDNNGETIFNAYLLSISL